MISQSPCSLIDSVKASVQSPSACTNDTVALLRQLLSAVNDERKPVERRGTRTAKTTSTGQRGNKSSRATRKVSIFQNENPSTAPLLPKQHKIVLATDIFNISSKTISEHIKLQSSRPLPASKNENRAPKISLSPKKPLQPSSPNRAIRSPNKVKGRSERADQTQSTVSNINSVAESAVFALSSLRTLKSSENGAPGFHVQLEQGLCILIGKLFAVGLKDSAIKELQELKMRIRQHLNGHNTTKRSTKLVTDAAVEKGIEKLENLLGCISSTPNDGSMLHLLISFQNLALRAVLVEGEPGVVQKMTDHLLLSNPCSPPNLLLAAYKAGFLSADKAAQQLQSLSSTILSLAALTISSGEVKTNKTRTKPTTTLLLQILSLEIKSLWWKIAGHKYDADRELWDPLSRYFSAFTRRCQVIKSSDFECLKQAFLRLKTGLRLSGHETCVQNVKSASVSSVLKALGQMAYTAGRLSEAVEFCKASAACLTTSNPLQLAICRCKIAFVTIEFLSSSLAANVTEIDTAINEAARSLSESLKGNLIDLDELLVEAAKLKKVILKITNDLASAIPFPAKEGTESTYIWLSIIQYLISFVRFLARYLGPTLSPDTDIDSKNMLLQRLSTCRNISLAAIDSSVALARLSLNKDTPPWHMIEPLLTDCFTFLSKSPLDFSLEDQKSGCASSGLLRLSNLYWSRYTAQKEAGKASFELVPLLESSINILGHCVQADQISGFIAIKLERLASIYSEIGHEAKAELNYSSSIRAHIKFGTLEVARQLAARYPPRVIWKKPDSPTFALGRVLNSYIKARLKQVRKTSKLIYDDDTLDVESRGTLLERQIAILTEVITVNPSDMLSKCFIFTTNQLLLLYDFSLYPLRRTRLVLSSMQVLLDSGLDFEDSFRYQLRREAEFCLSQPPELSQDIALFAYQEDLMTALRLNLGFSRCDLTTDNLQFVVQTWSKMSRDWATWESLESKVSEPQTWIAQLWAVADYLEVHAHWTLRITVLSLLKHVLELEEKQDLSSLITSSYMMSIQFLRLGFAEKAGEILKGAKYLTEGQNVCPSVLVSWHLAYAEYFAEMGFLDESLECIQNAEMVFESVNNNISKDSPRIRCLVDRMGVDGALLLSKISFSQGKMHDTVFYAKTAVKLGSRLWARLEKHGNFKIANKSVEDPELNPLTEKLAAIKLSPGCESKIQTHHFGSIYWPHFSSHCFALRQLAQVSAHIGLCQDAIYYAEQALEVANALGATNTATFIKAELGDYYVRSNQVEKGHRFLEEADTESSSLELTIHYVALRYHVSKIYQSRGENEAQLEKLHFCPQALVQVIQKAVEILPSNNDVIRLQKKISKLAVSDTKPRPHRQTKRPQKSGNTSKPTDTVLNSQSCQMVSNNLLPCLISRLRGTLIRRKASALISHQKTRDAMALLDEAKTLTELKTEHVMQDLCRANALLSETINKLANHGVYCVIPESCIALPSVQKFEGSQRAKAGATRSLKASKRNTKPVLSNSKKSQLEEDFTRLLSTAKTCLDSVFPSIVTHGSTKDIHLSAYLSSKLAALSYATLNSNATINLNDTVKLREIGRSLAFIRENNTIIADKQLALATIPRKWPPVPDATENLESLLYLDFQTQYLNILPENWDVISISLSDDRNEFVISKLRAHQEPFMLHIPLKRSDSEDDGEQTFSFDDGKNELLEILQLANQSAHDASAQADKKGKKEWWAKREALDTRLKDLLYNIENVWFGGFRGIFSQKLANQVLLDRFTQSFEKTLDKHLPSRRGKQGKAKSLGFHLDCNIMELFVNIERLADEDDPENSIMDLLYFVIDALQFQGERNAYDEIDFDMMVVETLDALRSYTEAEMRDEDTPNESHTILILDKVLHLFPWESLDCLSGRSVSRMPSFHCLRERILEMRMQEGGPSSPHGFEIDKKNGAYILNPTGDLKSTQDTFNVPLSQLDGWTKLSQKEPSEEEFRRMLESKHLLLYFGHGSGAQYIRGRTIRRLKRCAVTFLMGCSSGSMTEAGEFEPYGTPWNYVHAGSPALVATLWDVTDKDIDRFAKNVLDQWGLFRAGGGKRGGGSSSRSSAKRCDGNIEQGVRDSIGLDTAIARSRDACILKYLNGAAPVVYGVPVFLA
ncbi:separin protein [Ophidiomyces ophidiicola]|uniref:Separin protein n=1 Tax=Ophidiomyces ophidiicola TaxID=1387563 RepID=A0ACB8UQV3_9EURO|nr:separin protein [Ophidiomyces ophidiicola]KAI1916916.1 separin protein [Ophidiomyces ophidiicola]KAI1922522.1 separin protein [Ophidiomyces ophidiicola]KAI1951538.1 separin protein [Ophidiomyces ophidiicola]KAI1968896.1 separin protein [Ophidiomyces ophidiicola]